MTKNTPQLVTTGCGETYERTNDNGKKNKSMSPI